MLENEAPDLQGRMLWNAPHRRRDAKLLQVAAGWKNEVPDQSDVLKDANSEEEWSDEWWAPPIGKSSNIVVLWTDHSAG